jgi:hypothetical protein
MSEGETGDQHASAFAKMEDALRDLRASLLPAARVTFREESH